MFSPAGEILDIANEASDVIVLFRVDRATGALPPSGPIIQTDSPVCVVFLDLQQARTVP